MAQSGRAGYLLAALLFVSAEALALVAALLVSLPAAPIAGAVVALSPVPPLHPANSSAKAAQIANSRGFMRRDLSLFTFIHVFLSLWLCY